MPGEHRAPPPILITDSMRVASPRRATAATFAVPTAYEFGANET